ncbi:hypothetical protein ACQPZ2_14575 [Nocardia pseudovaccinii]|uniref:hypothetical protein n=1 Tax=Nocardia pseudovaccinii TaxID=189540 RepID=UPI003D8B2178
MKIELCSQAREFGGPVLHAVGGDELALRVFGRAGAAARISNYAWRGRNSAGRCWARCWPPGTTSWCSGSPARWGGSTNFELCVEAQEFPGQMLPAKYDELVLRVSGWVGEAV